MTKKNRLLFTVAILAQGKYLGHCNLQANYLHFIMRQFLTLERLQPRGLWGGNKKCACSTGLHHSSNPEPCHVMLCLRALEIEMMPSLVSNTEKRRYASPPDGGVSVVPFTCYPVERRVKVFSSLASSSWKQKSASSTQRASQAVPHPSTDRALQLLTSEFEWEPVYSLWYGR